MKQFLLPETYSGEEKIRIYGKDFHYLKNVLRLKETDTLLCRDRKGNRIKVKIRDMGDKELVLTAISEESKSFMPRIKGGELPAITLFQCVAKGKKMDQVIRQSTEIGVARIVPVFSEHTVAKPENGGSKNNRWLRIAQEAVQQSGGEKLPVISSAIPLKKIPEYWDNRGSALVFHQVPLENKALHLYLTGKDQELGIVIGPEGGFSPKEIELLLGARFLPVFLGENILRTETAAVYALAAVKTILAERNWWKI